MNTVKFTIIILVMKFPLENSAKTTELKVDKCFDILRQASKDGEITSEKRVTLFFGTFQSYKSPTLDFIYKTKAGDKATETPRLIVEEETGNIIYDYPLFKGQLENSLTPEEMLYHNMIMNAAGVVRLFFLFPYHNDYSITRRNIINLAKLSYDIMADLKMSDESIGLIASNIQEMQINYEGQGSGRGRMINNVIAEVGKQIRTAYNSMAGMDWKSEGFKSQTHLEKSREFLKIFLRLKYNDYAQITVIENPINLPLTQARPVTLNFINQFEFSSFKHNMDNMTLRTITDLAEELNEGVQSTVAEIGNEAKRNFTMVTDRTMDLDEDYNRFQDTRAMFSNLKKEDIKKVEGLVHSIIGIIKKLDINISKSKILPLLNNKDIFIILEKLTGRSIAKPLFWLEGFKGLDEYLGEYEKWVFFLKTIFAELPPYIVGNKIINNTVQKILSELANQPVKVKVILIGFSIILKLVKNKKLENAYNQVKDMEVGEVKLQSLLKALNWSNHIVDVSCVKENTMEIKGLVVTSRDIKKALQNPCVKILKLVEVFAFQTFVGLGDKIDLSGKNISIAIIAKDWFMKESVHILLKGKNAPLHPTKNTTKAGANGKPGIPGGPGGNFFGFAERFFGSGTIRVTTNGGAGGDGEDGTVGKEGRNGKFPEKFDNIKFSDYSYYWARYSDISLRYFPDDDDVTVYNSTLQRSYLKIMQTWHVWGTEGTKGLKGGHGGIGGRGGKPGTIHFINLSDKEESYMETLFGESGRNGKGAKGGKGGIGGRRAAVYCACTGKWYCEITEYLPGMNGEDGEDGKTGNYTVGEQPPEDPENYQPFTTINRFKSVVRERLVESINKIELRQFIHRLEQSEVVLGLYDHIGLTEELKSIEEQFHKLQGLIDLLPFYESLLNRIRYYSYQVGDDRDIKLLVNSLFTATFSRVCNLKNNVDGFMIVDVHHFLSKLVLDVRVLEEVGKEIMINNYVEDFKKNMNQQISGVDEMINNDFLPQMNTYIDTITDELQAVVHDLQLAKRKAEATKQEIAIVREEAWRKFWINSFLNTFSSLYKNAATLASMIGGPIGVAIEAGATGISMGLDKAVSTLDTQYKTKKDQVTESAKKTKEYATGKNLGRKSSLFTHSKEKVKQFLFRINMILLEMNKLKDKTYLGNVYEEAQNAKKDVIDLLQKRPSVIIKGVNSISRNLNKLIDSQYNLVRKKLNGLKEEKYRIINAVEMNPKSRISSIYNFTVPYKISIGKSNLKNSLETLTNVKTIHQMAFEVVVNFVKLLSEMNELNEMMVEVSNHLNLIEKHSMEIEDIVIPYTEALMDSFESSIFDLKGQNSIELTLSKFNFIQEIDFVQNDILKMVKGFPVGDRIKNCFQQLKEMLLAITEVFKNVQKIIQLKKLATYYGDIHSAKTLWNIRSKSLYNLVNQLEFIMQTSSLLVQYDRAINALKQYVFPFADYFLEEFSSLPSMDLGEDFKSILFTVIPQIEKLFSSLDDWITNINEQDTYIYQNIYFTDYNNQPFYTHRYSDFNATIKGLLKGNSLLMTPNIKEGLDMDGVKFNEISIKLKLANRDKQKEFDNILENFEVSMTHYGSNFYRCGKKYYVIHSERLTLTYSLKKDKNGRPLRTNVVYRKISMNGYILSPYTTWSIKLIPKLNNNFDSLNQFFNEPVDIVLEGRGQYIRKSNLLDKVCNGNLDKYYTEYDKNIELNEIIAKIDFWETEGLYSVWE